MKLDGSWVVRNLFLEVPSWLQKGKFGDNQTSVEIEAGRLENSQYKRGFSWGLSTVYKASYNT